MPDDMREARDRAVSAVIAGLQKQKPGKLPLWLSYLIVSVIGVGCILWLSAVAIVGILTTWVMTPFSYLYATVDGIGIILWSLRRIALRMSGKG